MPNEFGGELTYSLFETKQGQTITAALCKKKIFCAWLNTAYSSLSPIFIQADEVEAVLANTKQILNQFLRKSRILPEQVYTLEL